MQCSLRLAIAGILHIIISKTVFNLGCGIMHCNKKNFNKNAVADKTTIRSACEKYFYRKSAYEKNRSAYEKN